MSSTYKEKTLGRVISALSDKNITIDRTMLTNKDMREIKYMYDTNLARESLRSKPRSPEVVKWHTVMGLYGERAVTSLLSLTDLKIETPPVTANAAGVSYIDRKHDVRFYLPSEDDTHTVYKMEVKTTSNQWYDTIPLSYNAAKSVVSAMKVSDFLIYLTWTKLSEWQYRFRPRFIIDVDDLITEDMVRPNEFIIDRLPNWESPYRFDTKRARRLKSYIDLDITNNMSYSNTLEQFIS